MEMRRREEEIRRKDEEHSMKMEEREKKDAIVLDELKLVGVIDSRNLTGVTMSKCSHFFHSNCPTG